jgi:thiaminase
MAKDLQPNNRYRRWIEAYSNKEFNDEVNEIIAIFNLMANNTTDATRKKC